MILFNHQNQDASKQLFDVIMSLDKSTKRLNSFWTLN